MTQHKKKSHAYEGKAGEADERSQLKSMLENNAQLIPYTVYQMVGRKRPWSAISLACSRIKPRLAKERVRESVWDRTYFHERLKEESHKAASELVDSFRRCLGKDAGHVQSDKCSARQNSTQWNSPEHKMWQGSILCWHGLADIVKTSA